MGFFSFIEDAWDTVKDGAKKIGNAVKEGLKWAGDKAEDVWNTVKDVAPTVYKDAKEAITNVYDDTKAGLSNWVNRGFDTVNNFFNSPVAWLGLPIVAIGAFMYMSKKG